MDAFIDTLLTSVIPGCIRFSILIKLVFKCSMLLTKETRILRIGRNNNWMIFNKHFSFSFLWFSWMKGKQDSKLFLKIALGGFREGQEKFEYPESSTRSSTLCCLKLDLTGVL